MICCDRKPEKLQFSRMPLYTLSELVPALRVHYVSGKIIASTQNISDSNSEIASTPSRFLSAREKPFHEPILSFFHADSLYVKKTHGGIDMHRPFSSKDLPHLTAKAGWTLESSLNPAIVSWILKSFRNISEDLTISGRCLRWEQDVSWSHGPLGCYGRAT